MEFMQNDFDEFLKERLNASTAFVEGDADPLIQISVQHSPATIFGHKGDYVQCAENVNAVNKKGSAAFKPSAQNTFDIMHKSADQELAYWAGSSARSST
jgi:uncharacterized protein YunC (DUF1805 family)